MAISQDRIEYICNLTPVQVDQLCDLNNDESASQNCIIKILRINEKLNIELVESSIKLLCGRYEIFRSVIIDIQDGSIPKQAVLRERDVNLQIVDLRFELPDAREQELADIVDMEANRAFDLENDNLRVTLVRMGQNNYALVWCINSVIIDSYSMSLIINDFIAYYSQLQNGEQYNALMQQVLQYNSEYLSFSDYVAWLENQDVPKAMGYWEVLLSDFDCPEKLPAEHQPKGKQRSKVETLRLGNDLNENLTVLSKTYGLTVGSILETAWGILLQRVCGSEDVIFGKAVRHGGLHGVQRIAGMLTNTIPARVNTGSKTTVLELMFTMQKQALDSAYFSYIPLSEIQQICKLGSALNKTKFIYDSFNINDSNDYKIPNVDITLEDVIKQNAYPIILKVRNDGNLCLDIIYSDGVYTAEEVFLLLDDLSGLLHNMAHDPMQKVVSISTEGASNIEPDEEQLTDAETVCDEEPAYRRALSQDSGDGYY